MQSSAWPFGVRYTCMYVCIQCETPDMLFVAYSFNSVSAQFIIVIELFEASATNWIANRANAFDGTTFLGVAEWTDVTSSFPHLIVPNRIRCGISHNFPMDANIFIRLIGHKIFSALHGFELVRTENRRQPAHYFRHVMPIFSASETF